MTYTRTRRAGLRFLFLGIVISALTLWLSHRYQVQSTPAALVSLLPTLYGAYLAWKSFSADRRDAAADIDTKVKLLAGEVIAHEPRWLSALIGPDASRIDVAFHYRTEPAGNADGALPQGRLADVVTYYRNLRPARLVITGEPGAGKTILATDLLLGLLTHPARGAADPVPVRLSLANWDTDRPLMEWLADQVHDTYGLERADTRRLVDQHRILPILDGLDEMDNDRTPVGRRRAVHALRQLNAYQHPTGSAPVILTCRTTQYGELAALDIRMREAARIEIAPVTPGQAAAYLTARSANPARWAAVIDSLTTAPHGALARALSTPWRLNLAVTAYEQREDDTLAYLRDPSDLRTLSSPDAVRDHLLSRYVAAATQQHPSRTGSHRPAQVHRWLAALAAHLDTSTPETAGGGTDIVLHRLWPMGGPRRVRVTDAVITGLIVFTPLVFVLPLLHFGVTVVLSWTAVLGSFAHMVWKAGSRALPDPRVFQFQRLRNPVRRRRFVRIAILALGTGLALGLLGDVLFEESFVTFAIIGGVASAVMSSLGEEFMPRFSAAPATDPRRTVRDQLLGLLGCAVLGVVLFVLDWFSGHVANVMFDVGTGLGIGLAAGLLICRVGRRYLIFRSYTLGRLPWRLGAFLHWGCEAGLLRISGISYQFRHRELQDWLIAHPVR